MINGKKLFNSFLFAVEGIKTTFAKEQNFKIHLVISIAVVITATILDFSLMKMTILFFVIGVVLALELLNTAIERTVDLISMEKLPLAKQAKDAAAGAVLVFSVFAVIIGILLFTEPIFKWLMH
jgi:undecaprenol kinase